MRSPAAKSREVGDSAAFLAASAVVYSVVVTPELATMLSISVPALLQWSMVMPGRQLAAAFDSRPRMLAVMLPAIVTAWPTGGENQVMTCPAAVLVTWMGVVPVAVFVTAVVLAVPRVADSAYWPAPPRSDAALRRYSRVTAGHRGRVPGRAPTIPSGG